MRTVAEIDELVVTALVEDVVAAGYYVYLYDAEGSLVTRNIRRAIEYILDMEECTVSPVHIETEVVDGRPRVLQITDSPGGIYLTPGENGWDVICNYTDNETIGGLVARAEGIAASFEED